jgi:soluble lytic murein transglycosylase-like protein
LVAAVVQIESAFDPNAVSRAGASGLMQLMPSAAADREVDDVLDPAENLRGGAAHLRIMLDRFESLTLALAAYNAGAATVDRYGGVPPYAETRNYVRKVLELFCPGR